ncbi:hypothetical protein A2W32_04720 [candidate division WWE3 bacterium RBG_16_37_10]|uniref:Cytidyltransferase-like domain-containing protein n=1 Tax=candidate division WWE3 bacterium RBG_16_37_10 TaxID=1802610 RepID=A0A1F4V449_UNCKA|nr:MAG: hypothetical protein A2W32_04720 [candidate division WWE3 bacterium RBG_16_37_10]
MGQVKSLNQIIKILEPLRKTKKIGLITGCFDILHIGHITLFDEAKKHVDLLVVGLDSDEAIKKTKGVSRPIYNQRVRCRVVASLQNVDYVFPMDNSAKFSAVEADEYYDSIAKKIKPTYIITHQTRDTYWRKKKERAKQVGARFLAPSIKTVSSSTNIIDKIINDYYSD